MTAPTWFILRAISGQERRIAEALTDKGVTAYVPLHTTWAKHARRKATRSKPLIPGYVFADLPNDGALDTARSIRAVIEIMCNGAGEPRRVSPYAIGCMMLADAFHAFDETWTPPKSKGHRYPSRWKPGDAVRIKSGAFEGFLATVRHSRGRDRIDVFLSIFGRETDISVEDRQLELPRRAA